MSYGRVFRCDARHPRHDVGTLIGVATKSGGPDLYGGIGGISRARVLLLIGTVSVLGLVMGVAWTIARNDRASSDDDPTRTTPYVADAGQEELPAAGLRTAGPAHAVLPTVAPTSVAPSALAAPPASGGPTLPTAPATPPTPPADTATSTPAPASTSAAAPVAVATAPVATTSAAPASAAPATSAATPAPAPPTTAAPVPAAVQTPAAPPPASPSVVAPASEPAGDDRGDGGRDSSGRGSSGSDGGSSDGPGRGNAGSDGGGATPADQRKDVQEVAKELLAQAKAALESVAKGRGNGR